MNSLNTTTVIQRFLLFILLSYFIHSFIHISSRILLICHWLIGLDAFFFIHSPAFSFLPFHSFNRSPVLSFLLSTFHSFIHYLFFHLSLAISSLPFNFSLHINPLICIFLNFTLFFPFLPPAIYKLVHLYCFSSLLFYIPLSIPLLLFPVYFSSIRYFLKLHPLPNTAILPTIDSAS